ncbi:MAG: pantothenate kinase, partial [Bacteroidaceae bacterium]|nr:pantothenate kinase [Bacteroidaceae bacterium]
LTLLPQCEQIFSVQENIYNVHFHIPKYAEYRTAIGAALSYAYTNK